MVACVAGNVKLTSTAKGLEIIPESCSLSIPTDKMKQKYTLSQGVDISASESLELNCKVLNNNTQDIVAKPSFETHFRTIYGDVVPVSDISEKSISFEKGKTSDVSIPLPKALKPQAYDVKVSLVYGNESSNLIIAHYVMQGVSATIQNISLDKDYYNKGDIAKMNFSWSPSADSFPNSRLTKGSTMPEVSVIGKITDYKGKSCAEDIKQVLPSNENTLNRKITSTITRDCYSPKLSISLLDKDGNVLDQRDFKVITTSHQKPATSSSLLWLIIILSIVFIIFLFYLKNKNHNNTNNSPVVPIAILLIFIFSGSVIMYPLLKANAVFDLEQILIDGPDSGGEITITTTPPSNTNPVPTGLSANINFDKQKYNLGETMILTTTMSYTACTNDTSGLIATAQFKDNNGNYVGQKETIFQSTITGGTSGLPVTSYLKAPTAYGEYNLEVEIKGYYPFEVFSYSNTTTQSTREFSAFTLNEAKTDLKNYFSNFGSLILSTADRTAYESRITNAENATILGEIVQDFNDNILKPKNVEFSIQAPNYTYAFLEKFSWTNQYPFSFLETKVKVKVNEQDSSSITVNKGEEARVTWYSTNATSCTCTCEDTNGNRINCGNTNSSSCGSGSGGIEASPIRSNPYPIPNMKTKTIFKVHCE